jgi:ubiquinone/menaquinone biosynthesis C-methylase UbiE
MIDQQRTREAWDDIAAGYDEFVTPTHLPLAESALRFAGLCPGMHFLDVAAGTGALGITAARLGARVLATDISVVMVERLNARAREAGLANLEGRVMDGQALELESDTFDISGSQYGVMLFPDLSRGLSELVRVTKAGGRVLIVAFGSPMKVEFLSFFLRAMHAAVPGFTGPSMDPPPLPFQVADPEKLRQEMVDAGLQDIRVETVSEKLKFQSAKQLWGWVTHSHPIGAGLVAGLTTEQEAMVQQALDGMLRERSGGKGHAILTNPTHIATGTK